MVPGPGSRDSGWHSLGGGVYMATVLVAVIPVCLLHINDVLDAKWLKRQEQFSVKPENRGVVVTEAGSYLRLIDSCLTRLKAQGPSGPCNESQEKEVSLFLGVYWAVDAMATWNSNSRGARPVYISMIKWTRTIRLSIKFSPSYRAVDAMCVLHHHVILLAAARHAYHNIRLPEDDSPQAVTSKLSTGASKSLCQHVREPV